MPTDRVIITLAELHEAEQWRGEGFAAEVLRHASSITEGKAEFTAAAWAEVKRLYRRGGRGTPRPRPMLTDAQAQARRLVCLTREGGEPCEHADLDEGAGVLLKCNACGCGALEARTRRADLQCPKGYWPI